MDSLKIDKSKKYKKYQRSLIEITGWIAQTSTVNNQNSG